MVTSKDSYTMCRGFFLGEGMTKEEYNEGFEDLMFLKMSERDIEKRKEIDTRIELLRSIYRKSLVEERRNKDDKYKRR